MLIRARPCALGGEGLQRLTRQSGEGSLGAAGQVSLFAASNSNDLNRNRLIRFKLGSAVLGYGLHDGIHAYPVGHRHSTGRHTGKRGRCVLPSRQQPDVAAGFHHVRFELPCVRARHPQLKYSLYRKLCVALRC